MDLVICLFFDSRFCSATSVTHSVCDLFIDVVITGNSTSKILEVSAGRQWLVIDSDDVKFR